jgi:hypothetical protein
MAGAEMFIFTPSIPAVGPPILIQWYLGLFPLIMRSELKAGQSIPFSAVVNPRTCTSAPLICVQDVRMNSYTFSRRLPENIVFYRMLPTFFRSTRWRSWLRHCATSRKVAGSIPDGIIAIFHSHDPSGRTMALGSTQPVTQMSAMDVM